MWQNKTAQRCYQAINLGFCVRVVQARTYPAVFVCGDKVQIVHVQQIMRIGSSTAATSARVDMKSLGEQEAYIMRREIVEIERKNADSRDIEIAIKRDLGEVMHGMQEILHKLIFARRNPCA